jgi:hypothetical protein
MAATEDKEVATVAVGRVVELMDPTDSPGAGRAGAGIPDAGTPALQYGGHASEPWMGGRGRAKTPQTTSDPAEYDTGSTTVWGLL